MKHNFDSLVKLAREIIKKNPKPIITNEEILDLCVMHLNKTKEDYDALDLGRAIIMAMCCCS